MRLGTLGCQAVDEPACPCVPVGGAVGGGESGRLPSAFEEGDDELAITWGGVLASMDTSGAGPGREPAPLENLQQESDDSATPGDGVSAACVSPAEIEKDASAGW